MEEFVNGLNEDDLEGVVGGAATPRKRVKIVKSIVNVCSGAGPTSDVKTLGVAHLGDSYLFYGWSGNWAAIQFGAKKAYVPRDSVMLL